MPKGGGKYVFSDRGFGNPNEVDSSKMPKGWKPTKPPIVTEPVTKKGG